MTDASDLVEQLLEKANWRNDVHSDLHRKAATALTAKDKEIEALRERIDNAAQASAETQPDWKHRCYRIMGALGFDYGDPDWVMPDEQKRIDLALARAETAKRERDEARAALMPFAAYSVGKIERGKDFDYCIHVLCPLSSDQPMFKHFDAARAVINKGE